MTWKKLGCFIYQQQLFWNNIAFLGHLVVCLSQLEVMFWTDLQHADWQSRINYAIIAIHSELRIHPSERKADQIIVVIRFLLFQTLFSVLFINLFESTPSQLARSHHATREFANLFNLFTFIFLFIFKAIETCTAIVLLFWDPNFLGLKFLLN